MTFKLEYITRLLAKTSKKRIENYVISRIWHLLNSDEIKIMHQQYVSREEGKYALTDLYFPQLDYHIEVNEEFHYRSEEKIKLDLQRAEEIIYKTNHIVRVVDCQKDLKVIHQQIDVIVEEIKERVRNLKLSNQFRPWDENELTPAYWRARGSISVAENVNLRTIDDIGSLFKVKIKNRGFLKAGAAKYEKDGFSEVWWPSEVKKSNWENNFINNFEKITEKNLLEAKGNNHVQSYVNNSPDCRRIVFFKYRDELGFNFYKFVGCFQLNAAQSLLERQLVWERFSKSYQLPVEG